MFKSVVQELFPSFTKGEFTPDYFSFERSRQVSDSEEPSSNSTSAVTPISLNNQKDTHSYFPFYDYFFGHNSLSVSQDTLSEHIAGVLHQAITKPESLLKAMPIMPTSLTSVISMLQSNDFNLPELLKVVEQEPSMAADLVKLANTSRYKRGEVEVTDLQRAFMYIGADGLKSGVIEVYLKQYAPSPSLYFRRFGQKIWEHSVSSAQVAQTLALKCLPKDQADTVYFVALLRNLGTMVIFQLMVDAFKFVDPDAQPNTVHFKQLMAEHSLNLVLNIAKFWQLPTTVIELLQQQINAAPAEMSATALTIYEANIISTGKSLLDAKQWNIVQYQDDMNSRLISDKAKAIALDFIPEVT